LDIVLRNRNIKKWMFYETVVLRAVVFEVQFREKKESYGVEF
jgi:hypothetical protein